MARAVWKGPFVEESLMKKVDKYKIDPKKIPIKTWSRKSTIIPDFVGVSFLIYNGKKFIPLTVSEDMVGHKFGEFAPTRQFFGHTPADKKAKAEEAIRQASMAAASGSYSTRNFVEELLQSQLGVTQLQNELHKERQETAQLRCKAEGNSGTDARSST